MKRNLFIIIVIIFSITSCERDDICIDPTTPNLIIQFLDKDDTTLAKSVTNMSVKIINGSAVDSLNILVNDTIASLPVKVTEDITRYVLTQNSTNGTELIRDTISLSYTREEVFVGRSCGFKMIFKDITIAEQTNNWIQNIETTNNPDPQNIENETTPQVKIFH